MEETEAGAVNFYSIPQLAMHYDADNARRSDFVFYLRLAHQLRARRVVDIGSGTGLLASRLAADGHEVLGVEPQAAMLDLARSQPHASSVHWLHGYADGLPSKWADLVIMTGHVAQYFVDDVAWQHVLGQAHRTLRDGGLLAFEIRNAAVEAWRGWATEEPRSTAAGIARTRVRLDGDRVTHVTRWEQAGQTWTTTETLRFPSWEAMTGGLSAAGFRIVRLWGDFDGHDLGESSPEWIVLAAPGDLDR